MTDPYKILGVAPAATEDEIKTAYRELAKKYHPDSYAGNPLGDLAAEKMREIDEAYDAVMSRLRQSGGNDSRHSSGQTSGRGEFGDIRAKLANGRVDDAETLLDGVPPVSRNGEWFFLKGTVQYKRGWFEEANINFQKAYNMDPENREYKAAMYQMNYQRSGGYRQQEYQGRSGCSVCDICSALICADCCCQCIGGGGCC